MLWRRWWLVRSSVLLPFFLGFIFLLAAAPPSYAQRQNDYIQRLRERLWNIDAQVTKLQEESENWKTLLNASERRLKDLQSELATLRSELENLRQSLDNSDKQVAILQESLRQSVLKFEVASQIWTSSAQSWENAYNAERRRVKWARGGIVLASAVCLLAGMVGGYYLAK